VLKTGVQPRERPISDLPFIISELNQICEGVTPSDEPAADGPGVESQAPRFGVISHGFRRSYALVLR